MINDDTGLINDDTGLINDDTGLINDDTGLINDDTGLINDDTGLINDDTGLIENSAGLINDDTGMITDNDSAEHNRNGRRKRSRERGKDNKPRNFPLHTMKNLPQFRNKSHEEVRRYILEKKGVDIGGNFAWSNAIIWILIALVIVACGIGIAKWWKEKRYE